MAIPTPVAVNKSPVIVAVTPAIIVTIKGAPVIAIMVAVKPSISVAVPIIMVSRVLW